MEEKKYAGQSAIERLIELVKNAFVKSDDIAEMMNSKVDVVEGKGLSTEDFTTEEKEKLAGLSAEGNAEIPTPTTSDSGKFIRVNSSGEYALITVTAAEEVGF